MTKRWPTRVVTVGKVGVGGENPIRIQSMTTSNTRDVEATLLQIIRLSDVGCEIARVTVQGKKEAEACEEIKNGLIKKGYEIPLVADIHFYPPAAMLVAEFVDKVRVNPGNYVDRRAVFKAIEYTDESYKAEIQKIEEGFSPLVLKCKERKIAMRIGTNHGSLSDRIMNRYGDTPEGMVESALEFARVCRMHDYHNFLFSMKASNPLVMQKAYRLLVAKMIELGWNYPLHLGVTEAGEGEDGRVKSACGTGALLLDGLGDTIRVSLTEDPWLEIDPCRRLVHLAESYETCFEKSEVVRKIEKREVAIEGTGLHKDGSVLVKATKEDLLASEIKADIVLVDTDDLSSVVSICDGDETVWEKSVVPGTSYILLELTGSKIQKGRRFFEWLRKKGSKIPVILVMRYELSQADLTIHAAAEFGSLFSEGMGEGIMILADQPIDFITSLSFSILQATRMRFSKTDFIACPGCGRTLFDLQSVTKRIQEKTSHLPGVKIAIMGCVVNGPGEMADADFGYVGSKTSKIDLYVGKTCVEREIDYKDADERLIALIKEHGRWIEPQIPVLL